MYTLTISKSLKRLSMTSCAKSQDYFIPIGNICPFIHPKGVELTWSVLNLVVQGKSIILH